MLSKSGLEFVAEQSNRFTPDLVLANEFLRDLLGIGFLIRSTS